MTHRELSQVPAPVPGNLRGPPRRARRAPSRPSRTRPARVLFSPGDTATHFELLTKGEVCLEESSPRTRFDLRPRRAARRARRAHGHPAQHDRDRDDRRRAPLHPASAISSASSTRNGDIGLAFYKNLLGVVSDKVRRDRRRLDDMRAQHHPHAEGDEADARDRPRRRRDARSRSRSSSRSTSSSTTTAARTTACRRRRVPRARPPRQTGTSRASSRSARAT